jgi:8-oxo-dGTP pyrophosphatase MutT (NUDIX family)
MTSVAKVKRDGNPDVVISIVEKDGMVLMIERRDLISGSGYLFPGGKVEAAESLKDAAEREVREETNLDCRAVRQIGKRTHPISGARLHYWLCDFVGKAASKKPEFPVVWAPLEYLDTMAGPSLAPAVKAELSRRSRHGG